MKNTTTPPAALDMPTREELELFNTRRRIIAKAFAFARACQVAKEAKAAHTAAGFKFGDCARYDVETGEGQKCYRSDMPQKKWCKACQGKQAAWARARAARYAKIGAQKSLLAATKFST